MPESLLGKTHHVGTIYEYKQCVKVERKLKNAWSSTFMHPLKGNPADCMGITLSSNVIRVEPIWHSVESML